MINHIWTLSKSLLFAGWIAYALALSPAFGQEKSGDAKAEVDHVDLTHGHGGAEQENPMEFRADLALFTGIVFLLLCGGLYAFAWKPIRDGLELRESSIAKQIDDAKRASEEAKAKLAEYQRKLDAATQQAQEMIVQARKDAEASGQRIIAEAQQEAARQKDRALADIENAKVAALSELGAKSTDIAFSLARGILGRELKPSDHQQLIQDSMRSVASRN